MRKSDFLAMQRRINAKVREVVKEILSEYLEKEPKAKRGRKPDPDKKTIVVKKRPRGRPRKNPEIKPKKARGKPKKDILENGEIIVRDSKNIEVKKPTIFRKRGKSKKL